MENSGQGGPQAAIFSGLPSPNKDQNQQKWAKKMEYGTLGSQVIPDLSTDNAWNCLTSQIGRDTVFSA